MGKVEQYYLEWRDRRCESWVNESLQPGRKLLRGRVHKLIFELAKQNGGPDRKVLDVGCSVGSTVAELENVFGERFGVDIVEWPQWKKVKGRFYQCDVNESAFPFPQQHFDVVICSMVLEHVFDVFWLVNELARVCKSSGKLILGVPNICYIKNLFALLRGWAPRTAIPIYPFKTEQGWDGQHLHMFSLRETRSLLEGAGFIVEGVHCSGRLPKLRKLLPSLLYSDLYIDARKT